MAAPSTSVLTNFTGADESPLSEGGKWAGPIQTSGGTQMRRVSNACKGVGASGQSYRTDISAADQEAFCTVTTLPTNGNGAILHLRVQNPNTSTATSYIWVYIVGTGFQWYKQTGTGGNTFTQIGPTFTPHTLGAGEMLWANIVGTTLSGYYGAAGVWTLVDSRTDSTVTGAGSIALGADESVTTVLDDFGGGAVVTSTPSLIFGDRHTRRSTLLRL